MRTRTFLCQVFFSLIAVYAASENLSFAQSADQARDTSSNLTSSTSTANQQKSGTNTNNRRESKVRQSVIIPGAIGGRFDVSAGLPRNPPSELKLQTGTKIYTQRETEGEKLKIQTDFAQNLSLFDIAPANRIEHFQWLRANPYVVANNSVQIGWSGVIVDCQPSPGTGWIIKVRMRPEFHPSTRSPVLDFVEETYIYNNKAFRLVDSDANQIRPNLQRYPVIQ